jgi:defect-in-organelle-trafficking protein DotC
MMLSLAGCVSTVVPLAGSGKVSADTGPSYSAPDDLLNYTSDSGEKAVTEESMIAKAVRDAGRRLGATTAYAQQAEALYQSVAAYDQYLAEIFDFGELMLPEGIVPPVLAQADNMVSFNRENGRETKEIRAQVLKTLRTARFANSGGPHWRDYLRLTSPAQEKPHPQLQQEIDIHRDAWRRGVREGYERGIEQANQAFEIAINELSRDYAGMQLFRLLWLAGQVEAPKIVNQSENLIGGGQGSDEMSIGIRRVVISEPVYFVNDANEWTALIQAAMDRADNSGAGLSSIVKDIDNTQHLKGMTDEPDLSDIR